MGAIEAGGTKVLCAKWNGEGVLVEQARFDTREPEATIASILGFFTQGRAIDALGVGSFGPLCLNPGDPRYGSLTATPKTGWRDFALLDRLREGMRVPVAIATDVEAAALGEGAFGAARGLSCFAYVTVGTGIGAAIVTGGSLVRGMNHSELGHIYVPIDPADDGFEGVCPFHDRCLEGLASGPALALRTGLDPRALADDNPAFARVAAYLAHLCIVIDALVAPQRIIIGGAVVEMRRLHEAIGMAFDRLKGGYGEAPERRGKPLIVPPAAPMAPALLGARLLAAQALSQVHEVD